MFPFSFDTEAHHFVVHVVDWSRLFPGISSGSFRETEVNVNQYLKVSKWFLYFSQPDEEPCIAFPWWQKESSINQQEHREKKKIEGTKPQHQKLFRYN